MLWQDVDLIEVDELVENGPLREADDSSSDEGHLEVTASLGAEQFVRGADVLEHLSGQSSLFEPGGEQRDGSLLDGLNRGDVCRLGRSGNRRSRRLAVSGRRHRVPCVHRLMLSIGSNLRTTSGSSVTRSPNRKITIRSSSS